MPGQSHKVKVLFLDKFIGLNVFTLTRGTLRIINQVGRAKWPTGENQLHRLNFCILRDSKETRADSLESQTNLGPSKDPTGSLKGTSNFLKTLEPLSGCVHNFHIIHSITNHIGTLSRALRNSTKARGTLLDPSWTPKLALEG